MKINLDTLDFRRQAVISLPRGKSKPGNQLVNMLVWILAFKGRFVRLQPIGLICMLLVFLSASEAVLAQTWTSRSTSGFDYTWKNITHDGSKFVAVGQAVGSALPNNNIVMTSTDGVSWTPTTQNVGLVAFNDVIYANNIYVAVSDDIFIGGSFPSGGQFGGAWWSTDAITWNKAITDIRSSWRGLA